MIKASCENLRHNNYQISNIGLFVCFILCFALLCFYVSLLPALQFNCVCLIFMNMYVLCLYVNVLYMILCNIYICRFKNLCYVVWVLPTLNKTYLI